MRGLSSVLRFLGRCGNRKEVGKRFCLDQNLQNLRINRIKELIAIKHFLKSHESRFRLHWGVPLIPRFGLPQAVGIGYCLNQNLQNLRINRIKELIAIKHFLKSYESRFRLHWGVPLIPRFGLPLAAGIRYCP